MTTTCKAIHLSSKRPEGVMGMVYLREQGQPSLNTFAGAHTIDWGEAGS